jgi:NADH-quinone oxidoreductase subunit M
MLSLITFLPLIAAVIIMAIPATQKLLIRIIALAATLLQVVVALVLWSQYNPSMAGVADQNTMQFVEKANWISLQFGQYGSLNVDYYLGVDGISITMLILSAIVCAVGAVSSWPIEKSVKGYFMLYLLLDTAMFGCFVALDFFLFYVFWEVMLLPMYFLIGIWGGPNREYAAMKFFLYTLFGSVFMLLAMIGLYFSVVDPATGQHTFNMLVMMNPHNYVPGGIFSGFGTEWRYVGFIALFVGFAIKVPMFPFHTWLPDAHVEAPTPISVILAGVLLKLGTYGIMRICFPMFPDITVSLAYTIGIFGAINIIYGALCAMAQKDLKKLIAYSSVSHMGYVLLGLSALNTEGTSGALFQMFNHGTITSMLFLLVGVIYDRAHTREIDRFGGLATYMPVYFAVIILAFFASLGLPGFSGFISEAFVFLGSFTSPVTRTIAIVSTLGILLTAAYLLWALQRMFLGKSKDEWVSHGELHFHDWTGSNDVNKRELSMLIPLAVITIALGVYPMPILGLTTSSINALVSVVSHFGNVALK